MNTVLVVEDEPSVLMFLEEGLEERGYEVVTARSGGEALSMLSSSVYDISVLVTDIRIGEGLDGWDIARSAREITPSLPIVYVTGHAADDWDAEAVPNTRLLQKPFNRFQLAEAIESLLVKA